MEERTAQGKVQKKFYFSYLKVHFSCVLDLTEISPDVTLHRFLYLTIGFRASALLLHKKYFGKIGCPTLNPRSMDL